MDVQEWHDTLDWLTQPDGWVGRRDSKAERAYAVLAGYEKENGWIAHGIPAREFDQPDGRVNQVKPDAAYIAELQRDAIFQLAVLHELRKWDSRRPDNDPRTTVEVLRHDVVQAALTAPTGLRAKSVQVDGLGPYTEVDFAHRDSATEFFETVLSPRLMRLDASLGLADHVPPAYDPHVDELIEQWGRVWTAGVALAYLDWASAKRCRTAKDVAQAIWRESGSAGDSASSVRFTPALIPTERRLVLKAHADVRTRAAVTYAFAGNEALCRLNADEPSAFSLPLRSLSDARRVGGAKFYDGYNRAHLYLAVWSDCLHFANEAPAMHEADPTPASPAIGDASETATLAAELRAALAHVEAARRSLKAMRKALRGARRFHPGGSATAPETAGSAATAAEWEPISQGSLRLLAAEPLPGARWQPIASIDLGRELGPNVDWIDLLVVARVGDQQLALPMTTDDELVEGGGVRTLLVLDEGAVPPVSADALRRALQATEALVGVVVRKSFGAFVVLEIDMNTPQADAG